MVGGVVAAVEARRAVVGRYPDGVNPQALEVVEALDHTQKIPVAIAVAIGKAAGLDRVRGDFLPPFQLCRFHTPQFQFFGAVTGHKVIRLELSPLGCLLTTNLLGVPAAGMELAPARWVRRVCHIALHLLNQAVILCVTRAT